IFYAISALGNAGFTVHSGGLAVFEDNAFILAPLTIGVFVGSFGFPVFLNLIRARWTRYKWTLHTNLTLITTTVLLIAGAIACAAFELANPLTVAGEPSCRMLAIAVFSSAMMRSGGFAVVDPQESPSTTMLLSGALMFVGGGSG